MGGMGGLDVDIDLGDLADIEMGGMDLLDDDDMNTINLQSTAGLQTIPEEIRLDRRPFPDSSSQQERNMTAGPIQEPFGNFSLGQQPETAFSPMLLDPIYTIPDPESAGSPSERVAPHAAQRGLASLLTTNETGSLLEAATRPEDEAQNAGDPWSIQGRCV